MDDDYITSDVKYTITSPGTTDTLTLNLDLENLTDTGSEYTFNVSDTIPSYNYDFVVFKDTMPDLDRVKKMCNYYPALQKAYENFKTIYKMVEQDYKGNHEDQADIPF